MASPIEKITDPSFTSSSKGLMTLFCIGLFHYVIDINIIENVIDIPWFPKVEFTHPNKIFDLFIIFTIYALYRYLLHNKSHFRAINARAMYSGLMSSTDNGIGKWLIYKYILDDKRHFDLSSLEQEQESSKFYIDSYENIDEPSTEHFALIYNDSIFINQAESNYIISHGSEHKAVRKTEDWGNFLQQPMETSDYSTKFLSKIKSWRLRYILSIINLLFTLKLMFKSPFTFDFLIPVILNIGLVTYYIFQYLPLKNFNQWILTAS
ncbi:hypothetical protein HKA89_18540 [Vibrio parahaemolyticus]|uniref:hypothetical protein n=1 Tax=Vibrio parahaemolyticus TaxID=670 RepID=UPI00146A9BE8|nr:hypothetical protein [Vibrio parahaemolyticus]MDF5279216.1 hypothetical protein [Vibrio parahaemolyticus]NMU70744.1 hypothetical protein [Vibrio parahaemolyticus]